LLNEKKYCTITTSHTTAIFSSTMSFPWQSKSTCEEKVRRVGENTENIIVLVLQRFIIAVSDLEHAVYRDGTNLYLKIQAKALHRLCYDLVDKYGFTATVRVRNFLNEMVNGNTITYNSVVDGFNKINPDVEKPSLTVSQFGGDGRVSSWKSTKQTTMINGHLAKVYVNKTTGAQAIKKFKVDKQGRRIATYKSIRST
jgi:hypothetical protein